jgi:hypothetical protein
MSVARAQELEAAGDTDGAAREFVAARQHQEAARVFIMAARPLDAAIALLDGIAMIGPDLDAEPKGRVTLAAKLMREGGRDDYAKLMQGALGGGAAFPSAVLKSVLASNTEAPRPSVRAPSSTASTPSSASTSGTGFVTRGAGTSQVSAPRPPIAPTAPTPVPPKATPRPAPTSPPPASHSPAPRPATSSASPRPEGDRYKAEAGWHAADGAAIEETIKQFLESGRKGAAARVAWEAGQFERALPWFVELGLKYQEGSCLRSLGRPVEALAAMLEVPPDDSRYRRACFDAVALARETGRLDFEVDRFLTPFVAQGPEDESECDGFLDLADLYSSAGFAIGARRCAEAVLAKRPGDARAKSLVATGAIPRTRSATGSDRPARRVVSGDATALPSLETFVALARKHAPKKPGARR